MEATKWRVSAPDTRSISRRIASQAASVPTRIALAYEDVALTYEELERESSMLAARLRETGAAPDRCVGIFLRRSARFVVAALAVLKSGAAYVPLDPSTPAERVAFILADAGVIALVTDDGTANGMPQLPCPVITIDDGNTKCTMPFTSMEVDPNTLAYVVYTSGSTGKPKGVEITHANLCNLVAWHQSAFGVSATDRASQVAGLGFDAAGWEIWPYLSIGASVHIADESTRRSPEMLRDWIVAQRITIGFVPTTLAEPMVQLAWPSDTVLRTMLTGGDALRTRPLPDLPFVLVNNYGPTECTVVATSGTVMPVAEPDTLPSIGRPISGAVVLILDDALRPVACGEAGELCIGGAQVGRGYRNLPEQTARQFINYVCASGEMLRLYRTGDRARYLENGEIEFLGRVDDQVKIRGYRVELGEIVARLNRCPGIQASAVSLRNNGECGPALVAHIVPVRDTRLAQSEVRDFLARQVPDYMIPAYFVSISTLPVTANGKLDGSALPAPTAENVLPSGEEPATSNPSSPFQQQIGTIVASLLKRPAIGDEENFFMAGGHSMLGVQLVARIRDTFGVKLTLRDLFKAPTIAALTSEVARLTNAV